MGLCRCKDYEQKDIVLHVKSNVDVGDFNFSSVISVKWTVFEVIHLMFVSVQSDTQSRKVSETDFVEDIFFVQPTVSITESPAQFTAIDTEHLEVKPKLQQMIKQRSRI